MIKNLLQKLKTLLSNLFKKKELTEIEKLLKEEAILDVTIRIAEKTKHLEGIHNTMNNHMDAFESIAFYALLCNFMQLLF